MRLDKFLCEVNVGSRSQVRELIRQGLATVNGSVVRNPEQKISEDSDEIRLRNVPLCYQKFRYFMLHKPTGVVSATRDHASKTVLDLLEEKDQRPDLFPVGRLDRDAGGLLLLTNDGELAHRLLAPKNHVDKTYLVTLEREPDEKELLRLEQGVDIGEEKLTLPCRARKLEGARLLLTIHEGRYHQVKRMAQAIGNQVISLKRVSFGGLSLDEGLRPGEYRELTEEELRLLRAADAAPNPSPMLQGIDAVIFDLDGSLVDSMWLWRAIDIEYLGRFGIPLPENLQSEIEGMSFSETAVYFQKTFQIPASLEEIKAEWNRMAWDKYANEVPLKPGIPAFLEGCRRRGIRLGIATSNSRELVENVAGVHNLRDYFSCIMTGCDVERGKPSPDIYLAVARELQVPPERCLVFEDIIPGIQAGLNAGMRVCAVEDAYSVPDRERKRALADYYVEDYHDLF